MEMRNVFGINGNKLILLTYVGNNRFIIDVQPQQFVPQSLPSYHSYKCFDDDPISFDVTLTADTASHSQLVRFTYLFYVVSFNHSCKLH
jgi:hypothetical protein